MRAYIARAAIAAAAVVCSNLAVAGPLTPPGAPAPTGKTLTEVEPRIAVNSANTPGDATSIYRITAPGSYYLTGDVMGVAGAHGICIETGDVTLDLGGFSLVGVEGSLNGIHMPEARMHAVVQNGHVRGWGGSGVAARIGIGRIERISASFNGAWGIDNASSFTFTTHVIQCEAMANGVLVSGAGGIRGGVHSRIVDCLVFNNVGVGILAGRFGVVSRCTSDTNIGDGIVTDDGSTVSECHAVGNIGDGIEVASDSLVVGNSSASNGASQGGGAGIHVIGSDNRIEGNHVTDSGRGVDVDASGNFIARNTCSGNTVNWDVAAGNVCLVVQGVSSGAIAGNSGGVAPGSADPNANFTY